MFAFALWDGRSHRLFAARDRLGIKPLYYAVCNGMLVFASEIKSVLASGLLQTSVNYRAFPEFFTFGQTVDNTTLFEGVLKLMPGHWLSYDGRDIKIQRYWDWQFDEASAYLDDRLYVERFTELIERFRSLPSHERCPSGVIPERRLGFEFDWRSYGETALLPVQTFTVGFEDKYAGEFEYARTVAAHIGAQHHEAVVTAKEFIDSIPKLIWHEDEPLKGRQASHYTLYPS
jgi:asparagine synthase (glutamine-hydrolysing)